VTKSIFKLEGMQASRIDGTLRSGLDLGDERFYLSAS
jgi:hypothetical protein